MVLIKFLCDGQGKKFCENNREQMWGAGGSACYIDEQKRKSFIFGSNEESLTMHGSGNCGRQTERGVLMIEKCLLRLLQFILCD
jgi:hypothetical protein